MHDRSRLPGHEARALPALSALLPRGRLGHQFVVYGDSCSGVAGGPNEASFAAINRTIRRLHPPPEFVCFLGDEILGLTADPELLRAQWRTWLDAEMGWLDHVAVPLYHTTGNHTTYDPMSEGVFREALPHLPRNGPRGQEGLSYFVRRDDLLLVFLHTAWSGLGGEGRIETDWLSATLRAHGDARHKLVLGHHPVHPVNGFSGPLQREIESGAGRMLWDLLVEHQVLAYLCSHILAFDAQVHRGVLQIVTAGAGTRHRMPEGVEYLHFLQAALDERGLRFQVIDADGVCREWLEWPLPDPAAEAFLPLRRGTQDAPAPFSPPASHPDRTSPPGPGKDALLLVWDLEGVCPTDGGEPQTLLSAHDTGSELQPLWIGLRGREHQLSVLLIGAPGESPHQWIGPLLRPGEAFRLQLALHTGMGPGGFLWRWGESDPWSSLPAASPWGGERLRPTPLWSIGHGQRGPDDLPFRSGTLRASWQALPLSLQIP